MNFYYSVIQIQQIIVVSLKLQNHLQTEESPSTDDKVTVTTNELLTSPILSKDRPDISVINSIWSTLAKTYPDKTALLDPHSPIPTELTFKELHESINQLASGFSSLKIARGDRISIFSENSSRWLIADQAVMTCGAIDAVRGTTSSPEELMYILEHSNSCALIVQDRATLEKLLPSLQQQNIRLKFIMLLWDSNLNPNSNPNTSNNQNITSTTNNIPIFTFEDVIQRGNIATTHTPSFFQPLPPPQLPPKAQSTHDIATLVYTSGTTGNPKGVALTHSNITSQFSRYPAFLKIYPGQRALSLLPPWHIYERTASYYVLACGGSLVYTSIRRFKDDLIAYPPDFFVCVPLVLDTLRSRIYATLQKASIVRKILATSLLAAAIEFTRAKRIVDGVDVTYALSPPPLAVFFAAWLIRTLLAPLNWLAQKLVVSKIRSAIGIKECAVCGGGSLAPHLDDFYEAIGLRVLNGWGLTETSPVLACRSKEEESEEEKGEVEETPTTALLDGQHRLAHNVRGSVGKPIRDTTIRIVDPETKQRDLPDGQPGLILAKGPGVMTEGYYKNPEATQNAFIDGWFDTGDIGWRAPMNVPGSRMGGILVLSGRAKDTLVLSSGENVEPAPLEDAICQSPLIKSAVMMGQGRRSLGALIFLDPENVSSPTPDNDGTDDVVVGGGRDTWVVNKEVENEVSKAIKKACRGRVAWEQVTAFVIVKDPLSADDGTLTRTLKPRRPVIYKKYEKEIKELESKLR